MKKILAVDLGSYSVKFYETLVESRSIHLESYEEVLLENFDGEIYKDMTTQEIQFSILAKYIKKNNFVGKVISHLPNEMMTSRYLDLPVSNKKKAEMMIPFQLEENLPFPISSTHYACALHKVDKNNFAQVCVTQRDYFSHLYQYLNEREILPAVITSELFSLQSYITKYNLIDSFCFLDIGHLSTKAYFIENGRIVANHTSHIAGFAITEIISQSYNISMDEALIYKHDNCFMLTDKQLEEVNQDQRDFAELMKKTLWPLILDLRRWEVGHRVKHGKQVNKILITGGSSNIDNLDHFISDHIGLPVEIFSPYEKLQFDLVGVDEDLKHSMTIAHVLTEGQQSKQLAPNLLYGDFAGHYSDSIPLHSSVFIGVRVVIIALFAILGFLVERSLINKDIRQLDQAIMTQLQSSDLEIPRRTRDLYRVRPMHIYREINQRYERVEKELKAFEAISKVNAIDGLMKLNSEIPSNQKISLKNVYIDNARIRAEFYSDYTEELERLQVHLLQLNHADAQVFLDKDNRVINYTSNFN